MPKTLTVVVCLLIALVSVSHYRQGQYLSAVIYAFLAGVWMMVLLLG